MACSIASLFPRFITIRADAANLGSELAAWCPRRGSWDLARRGTGPWPAGVQLSALSVGGGMLALLDCLYQALD